MQAEEGMTAVVATDGFFEVIDSAEAARILTRARHDDGMTAGDAAKILCRLALEKGSSDNVSVVVIFI